MVDNAGFVLKPVLHFVVPAPIYGWRARDHEFIERRISRSSAIHFGPRRVQLRRGGPAGRAPHHRKRSAFSLSRLGNQGAKADPIPARRRTDRTYLGSVLPRAARRVPL